MTHYVNFLKKNTTSAWNKLKYDTFLNVQLCGEKKGIEKNKT